MSTPARAGGPGEGFGRERRLTQSSQFKRVFADASRAGRQGFVVLYRPNGLDQPRLGLAIAKKCARRAVDRNRLKRIARESFRRSCQQLPGVDIVVLCAQGAPREPNQRLFDVLERAWAHIGKSSCVES
ncbi:ribonuclease P protein component [Allochromatium vinosum]|uniref:Ribonuclease P protein component n=1 Tax=Allochromatium vinosum (strain ATCC 17899 / DSM 180 / NBRC 103801 / NCIMB 10441 / D) TaxID=572477 RepID=D3RS87_ALLVD|nr:ribonuclease P protein component [Allochromatium vinosum]ADC64024.1 ribonuclease P protein component [Allochromatium vinosum DSM 180]